MQIDGTTALVTGASRGLGRALALALGTAGAHVIAVARTVGGLEELDDQIRAAGGTGATLVPFDLTDDPALGRLGAAIHERWGRLDIWAHAAIDAPMLCPAEHIDAADLDRGIAVNLRATQRLIAVLDPLLRRAPAGRALFFRDPEATTDAYHGAYGATKAAGLEIAAAWSRGLSSTSVRTLEITPPRMSTALRARFHPGVDPASLATPANVATAVVEALAAGATGPLDLTGAG